MIEGAEKGQIHHSDIEIDDNSYDSDAIKLADVETAPKNTLHTSSAPKNNQEISQENKLKCNYCHKIFTRSDNLNRHIKDRCKAKKKYDDEKEEMFRKLVQQMDEQNKKIKELESKLSITDNLSINNNTANTINDGSNTTNTVNTINNIDNSQNVQTNNIKLVAFGQQFCRNFWR